jgi:ParB-like chromosome segregation protein Spo0J
MIFRSPSACPSWPCDASSRWAICCPASARPIVRKQVDATTIRHLTMASKSQQKAWLALFDDADAYCPTGHQLKQWLFGGQSIPVSHALFDTAG